MTLSKSVITAYIVLAIALTALNLVGCASKPEQKNLGDFELGEQTAPPSGCTILRSQVEKENKSNGTNKESGC